MDIYYSHARPWPFTPQSASLHLFHHGINRFSGPPTDRKPLTMTAMDPNSDKEAVTSVKETTVSPSESLELDAAWTYLNEHRDTSAAVNLEAVNLSLLRRKIDWHIVPLMFLCYTLQFLDKVILNASPLSPLQSQVLSSSNPMASSTQQ